MNAATEKRWAKRYPELGSEPIPIEPYTSPEHFELEREAVFRRAWLNVGREEEIARPGDFLVRDLPVLRTSLLLARDDEGRLRAFHNMCSHRGTRLVSDRSGCERNFICRYHHWTYALDGTLKSVPDVDQFFDLDKSHHGLKPVALDVWEGFVFVNLSSRPKWTLTEYLGDVGRRLTGYPFAALSSCVRYDVEVACNWKLLVDAFQETYHAQFLHDTTLPDVQCGKDNPMGHPLAIELYPQGHRLVSLYGNPAPTLTEVDKLLGRFASSIRSEVSDLARPGVNPTQSPTWSIDLDLVFPNFSILLFAIGICVTYNFWPLAVDRTLFEVRIYFPPAENAGQRFAQEYNRAVSSTIIRQDVRVVEEQQMMLRSGANTHFVLQDNEIAVRHAHKTIEGWIADYRGGRGQ